MIRRQIAFCSGLLLAAVFAADPSAYAIFPRGGVVNNTGANPDPTIPAVGSWLRLTSATQGDFIAKVVTTCNQLEGANPTACNANTAGSATATASISGTTLTRTAGTGTVNNLDVITGAGVTPGTYVVSGGPLAGNGTLTLNNSQTVSSRAMVVNPPMFQASTIAATVDCTGFNSLIPFSAPTIDPNNGDVFYEQTGGHAVNCQSVGIMRFSVDAARSGGGQAPWTQVVPPARFMPNTYPKPGYSTQAGGTAASEYYNQSNVNGEYLPIAVHTYNGVNATNDGYLLFGGIFGCYTLGCGVGGGYFYDSNYDNEPIGPIVATGTPTVPGFAAGYFLPGDVNVIGASFGTDNNLYALEFFGFNWYTFQLSNPYAGYKNSPTAPNWKYSSAAMGSLCFPYFSAALTFPDPRNSGHMRLIGRNLTTGFCTSGPSVLPSVAQVDNTGSPGTYEAISLTGHSPLETDCGGSTCNPCTSSQCDWALTWDPDDNLIIESDGSHNLGQFTPNSTTTWAAGTLTTSSAGTPPPDPSATGCGVGGSITGLKYLNINGAHVVEMAYCADVWRYTISDGGCQASADGVVVRAGVGRACSLTDGAGHVWSFGAQAPTYFTQPIPNYTILKDGVAAGWVGYKLTLSGGNIFIGSQFDAVTTWADQNFRLVSAPGATAPNHASIGATQYQTIAVAADSATNGQTIQLANPTGIPYFTQDAITLGRNGAVSSVTINGNGTAMYAAADSYGNGAIIDLVGATDTTISNIELGFNHSIMYGGPFRCLNITPHIHNVTLTNSSTHDCDGGLLTSGDNGTLTFTNDVWDHNDGDGGNGSAEHNIYLSIVPSSADTTVAHFSGGGSYCNKNTNPLNVAGSVGFEFKSRISVATVQNFTIAQPSQHGYSDCAQSTAISLPCGGDYTFGGTTMGTGVVIELGPNEDNTSGGVAGARGIIRYGEPDIGNADCPAGGGGYATNSLLVQGWDISGDGCWIINDTGAAIPADGRHVDIVNNDPAPASQTVQIKNCKIIDPYATSIANALGAGGAAWDGGGNTLYHSRDDAGIAAYPFLPTPMSIIAVPAFFGGRRRRLVAANDNALQAVA